MKTTTRKPAPKSRPTRTYKIVEPATPECAVLTIRLTVAGESTTYDVTQGVMDDRFRVWLWRKVLTTLTATMAQKPYVTDVGGEFGDSCTCKGGKYHGHCKHIDGTRALIVAGKLPNIHEEAKS